MSSNNVAIAQRQGGPVCACTEPIVVQNGDRTVRFTPITKELIRIEDIGPGRQFVDDPTFFAMNRDRAALNQKVEPVEVDGETVLDTGVMRLTFRPDGRPLHRGNLEIRTSPGATGLAAAKPWRWNPEKRNEDQANLGYDALQAATSQQATSRRGSSQRAPFRWGYSPQACSRLGSSP